MIRNQGFTEIALDLTVLLFFSVLFAVECICIKETSKKYNDDTKGYYR